MLERSRALMQRDEEFGFGQFGFMAFSTRSEDDGSVRRAVTFPTELWHDLGSPEVLTVTIEPGNTLHA